MMRIEVLRSKIHRVHVTQAELNDVGSITLDEALMEAAQVIENKKVQIVDVNHGEIEEAKQFKPTVYFPNADNRLN